MAVWPFATWPRDVGEAVEHTPCRVRSLFIAPSENIMFIGTEQMPRAPPAWIKTKSTLTGEFSAQAQPWAGLSTAHQALPTLPNPHLRNE